MGMGTRAADASEQEPIRLEYAADPGCPSAERFERMVFERTHSARPAQPGEQARLFSITVHRTEQTVQGSLTVQENDRSLVRRVQGRDCTELASVLALATALAIDPSAELSPQTVSSELPPEPPPAPPAPPATTRPNPPPNPFDPPDALPSESSRWDWAIGLGPRMDWASTPYPAAGPSFAVSVRPQNLTWSVGAAANLLFTPSKEVDGALATFRILTLGLQACGLALRWQHVLDAGACAHVDFGEIYGSSSNITFEQEIHRVWSTFGVHLDMLIHFTPQWRLVLNVGPNLVLTQYRFEFNDPETTVYEQGSWAGSTRLMLEHQF